MAYFNQDENKETSNNSQEFDTKPQTADTIIQGNVDTTKFPTSPVLLEYALAVYFYHFGAMKAQQDIMSESPNANGLFPSTVSNYEIETTDYERDTEMENVAKQDLKLLLDGAGDVDIAESYKDAMEAVGQED